MQGDKSDRHYPLFPRAMVRIIGLEIIDTMATKIRLRRMGARNKPFYRLVVADSRFATTGRFLEALGWYDPKQKADNFSVNLERVNYWLGTGAQLSTTAKSLVKKAQIDGSVPAGEAPAAAIETPVEAVAAPAEEIAAPAAEKNAEDVSEKPAEEVSEKKEA